ncbi:hypothetical protein [Cellulomonas soli]
MAHRIVSKDAVKRSAATSVKASAKLESRVVDSTHVRSAAADRYLASRTTRTSR